MIDGMVTTDILHQHLTSCSAKLMTTILDDRKLGRDIGGMHIVRKTNECHILGDAEIQLFNSRKGSKGNNIIEC